MAAPNIVDVTSIYGRSSGLVVTTTVTAIVSNSSSSGKVLKVNALLVANVDGTNNAAATVDLYDGTNTYHLAKAVVVPAVSTLDVLSKPIYLEEGQSIRITAGADGDLEAVCSYEEIS